MKRVAIDVDGVLADIHSPLIDLINTKYGAKLTYEDIVEYDAEVITPKGKICIHKEIHSVFGESSFWREAPPLEGIECVHELPAFGLSPFIVTSRPLSIFPETKAWLEDQGINWPLFPRPVIETFVNCIFLQIDDFPKNIIFQPHKCILMSQPWNKDYDEPNDAFFHRTGSWEDVIELFKSGWLEL
jgi:5'(3')-deoxyribonucleotidase